ncbi:Uncharacterised protein [Zhongshania aliphaticivorans]|uniref:DUF4345 domain-containing protein n=3 Tax=Zhongshania aliphaticivorans TaxID=1470434 RepID=A0A5S9QJQ0_9GAMM|nr:DUF4345 domain-containing protein [Zhongshania aliphaticivorans]CAA0111088.1 Uncharacterised protein [Zhongshania aliphaticivorans]CAA0118442.1 Uncharacterised protein [Zhongshania aliphaticivorans]
MNISKFLINITASIFTLYGVGFIFFPVEISLLITDFAPTNATALTDMRATYGGMSAAIGLVLFVLASKPQWEKLGVFAVLVFMLGMAIGRIVGLFVDGSTSAVMYVYLALEIVAFILSSYLLSKDQPQ